MGAALEFIETGVNGWLVPANDGTAIIDAMREAARLTRDELEQVSQAARASVQQHTLAHGAARFMQFAHEIVGVALRGHPVCASTDGHPHNNV
jgi:glycosyltransferase involved in cell wall biosynthesis